MVKIDELPKLVPLLVKVIVPVGARPRLDVPTKAWTSSIADASTEVVLGYRVIVVCPFATVKETTFDVFWE